MIAGAFVQCGPGAPNIAAFPAEAELGEEGGEVAVLGYLGKVQGAEEQAAW